MFKADAVATKEGACCEKDQIYSFDSSSGKGSCCAPGETFTGGKCQVPKKDPPVPDAPAKDPCNKCSSNFVCACDGTLGIKYGKCYTMTDVNGLQLNRDVLGTYQSGGDIGNLIFKVNIPLSLVRDFTGLELTTCDSRFAKPRKIATNHPEPLSRRMACGLFRTSSVAEPPRGLVGLGI